MVNIDIIIRNIKLHILSDGDVKLDKPNFFIYEKLKEHFNNLYIDEVRNELFSYIGNVRDLESKIIVSNNHYSMTIKRDVINEFCKYINGVDNKQLKYLIFTYLKSRYKYFEKFEYKNVIDDIGYEFEYLDVKNYKKLI